MKKILVLDDDKDILIVMQALLRSNGYEVELVNRWEDVFNKIESFKPDLILLDYFLSGNTGDNICREIKIREEMKHIPILMFSAHLKNNDKYGADDFIEKPFEASDMFAKIGVLMN